MKSVAGTLAAPFPYFGGKSLACETVWAALGDPENYVEPFAGSAAVLLARPPHKGRRAETLNDADGWLVNMWRAIQHSPDAVADAALSIGFNISNGIFSSLSPSSYNTSYTVTIPPLDPGPDDFFGRHLTISPGNH